MQAIEAELGDSVEGCYFIGDSLKDLQAGQAKGCRPVLVLTGKGEKTRRQLADPEVNLQQADSIPVYENLLTASKAILETAPA